MTREEAIADAYGHITEALPCVAVYTQCGKVYEWCFAIKESGIYEKCGNTIRRITHHEINEALCLAAGAST